MSFKTKIRDDQKLIAGGFIIASFTVLIGFLLLGLLFRPDFGVNYIGMPTLALGLALIEGAIENNRLEYELSQR